ncbi:DNA-3-methyladenine glycosylase [Rhizobium sp. L1K21]|uniref:DNA-3-methyladenine glycosylase family protein n=1 Tax=Rhizobium sp. L1K21 TaxID=2954933 RepID=UPI002091E946|nr:DNA-3-methyladenine glycosylase [Rhizobium sp. L1K21]MCO6188187.1 DNA-3-methyladenine glycosylase [Rhizobium sp. L1K21]
MRVIRHMGDVDEGLEALATADPRLEPVIAQAGDVPLRLQPPGFEGLANIIVSQMISRAAANRIWERLQTLCGPQMEALAFHDLSEEQLRAVGLSGAKARTLLAAAEAVSFNQLDLHGICALAPDDAVRQLTAIKGLGPWTAEIYLMFCAGHADIFPVGDVALQNAVAHGLGLEMRQKGAALASVAALWSPWRSVAARLFWAYYSRQMRRETNVFG